MNADDEFSERAATAWRSAMAEEPDGPGVDPTTVRQSLRRRRRGTAAVAAVVVLVLGVVVLPRLSNPSSFVASPIESAVPAGWRLEQYRNLTIQVPDSWGYVEPGTTGCGSGGTALPYLELGHPGACSTSPGQPQEHVEVAAVSRFEVGSAEPSAPGKASAGWWFVSRLVGDSPQVRVSVVSRDRPLADRIAASARVDAGPCPATSEVQRVGSRTGVTNLEALKRTDELVICQYDPDTESEAGGLRAARPLAGEPARKVAEALARTLTNGSAAAAGCSGLRQRQLELAVTVRLVSSAEIWVTAGTCIDPADANTLFGGVDGGGTLRTLPSSVCELIVQPPIRADVMTRGLGPCDR